MLLHGHGLGLITWNGWHNMPSAVPLGLMLFDIWIQVCVLADLIQDVIDTSVVYLVLCWMLLDWCTPGDNLIVKRSIFMVVAIDLDCYGLPNYICKMCSYKTMTWPDVFFNGLHHSCHARLIDFRQHVWSLHSSLSLFCPVSRCTDSSHISITFQSKVHLHWWWKRNKASFRFSWAITETCCHLLGIPLASLPSGFLMTLQMLLTVLLVRILSLSGLSSPCSLMSNLAASELNLICKYIFLSHMAIHSSPHAQCTC